MRRLLTLTDEQRVEITQRYKHDKNPRLRERLHCLLRKERAHTTTEVAHRLLVVAQTVTQWLNLHKDGGLDTLCRMETGGSDGFLRAEQRPSGAQN